METITKRHPIRGFLYGILLGLGLMLLVVGQGIAALGTWPPFIVLLAGIVIGTLWGTFGPAKGPKGPPPAGATVVDDEPTPEPEPVAVGAEAAAGDAVVGDAVVDDDMTAPEGAPDEVADAAEAGGDDTEV